MSTRSGDLAPPFPVASGTDGVGGYFERGVVAGSCIYNGQGCASAVAAGCDWERPASRLRARGGAPSRASRDDPGRGYPRAAPCKARGHNYPLPLSGQVFPSSLFARSLVLFLSVGAPPLGTATAREAHVHAHHLFVCFSLFLPPPPHLHMVTSRPPPRVLSLPLPALRCECLRAWPAQFGYLKLARYGYS